MVFEQHDGEYELHIDGKGLKAIARQMTSQQRHTPHCGGPVERIEVVKRESES